MVNRTEERRATLKNGWRIDVKIETRADSDVGPGYVLVVARVYRNDVFLAQAPVAQVSIDREADKDDLIVRASEAAFERAALNFAHTEAFGGD
jgi:hypothetical protein